MIGNGIDKTKRDTVVKYVKAALTSPLFPYITAAVMLLCYYAGLDIVAIYYLAITALLILLLLDDLTPLITFFLFLLVFISYKNSPSYDTQSGYYFQPAILIQTIIAAGAVVCACIYRVILTAVKKRFKPTSVFLGLCVLSASFLLNGVLNGNGIMNFGYGVLLSLVYLGVFVLLKDNLKIDENSYKFLAHAFTALSILLVTELYVAHLTRDGIYVNGVINREGFSFGWGVYNTMGFLLLLCIPSVMYLASIYKRGYVFTIYSLFLAFSCFMSMSRQAMVGVCIIYPASALLLFIKTGQKKIHLIIYIVFALAALAFVVLEWKNIFNVFKQIFANIMDDEGVLHGSGRMELYKTALDDFASSPIFGVGFFNAEITKPDVTGLGLNLHFYHNTFLQMMGSCGMVGLICYVVHRITTVLCFCNNITADRSYVGLSIMVILLLSLVDVHMFDVLPTFVYSFLLAVVVATDKKPVYTTTKTITIRID